MTKEDNKLANKTFFSIIANYVTIVLIVYIDNLIYDLVNVNLNEVNIIVEILISIILLAVWPLLNIGLSIASIKIAIIEKSKMTVAVIDIFISIVYLCFEVIGYILGSLNY